MDFISFTSIPDHDSDLLSQRDMQPALHITKPVIRMTPFHVFKTYIYMMVILVGIFSMQFK